MFLCWWGLPSQSCVWNTVPSKIEPQMVFPRACQDFIIERTNKYWRFFFSLFALNNGIWRLSFYCIFVISMTNIWLLLLLSCWFFLFGEYLIIRKPKNKQKIINSLFVQGIDFQVFKTGFTQVMLEVELAEYLIQMDQVMLLISRSFIVEMILKLW